MAQKFTVALPTGEEVRFPVGWRQQVTLELVRPGRALLDVGCGRGGVASALAGRFERVAGVDGDPEQLASAARRGIETHRVDLDAEPLPFEDGAFDAVVCLEVVEHVLRPDLLARELARVLEPGGRLYLSTPNVRHPRYVYDLAVRGRFPLTSSDPADGFRGGHLHPFTWSDLDDLLRGAGFERLDHHGLPRRNGRLRLPRPSAGLYVAAVRGERLPDAPAVAREPRSE